MGAGEGLQGAAGGICEANPPRLYLGAAALNNAHAVGETGRKASSADEKSKGTQTAGDVRALNVRAGRDGE